MRSSTPAGSSVDRRRSLTSRSRRWPSSWCSSSACWRRSRSMLVAVDERLGGIAGEDRERRLVVRVEPVAAVLRDDDHAVDGAVERHRHQQHRLGAVGRADDQRARVARARRPAGPTRRARRPSRSARGRRRPAASRGRGWSRRGRRPGTRSARTCPRRGRPDRPGSCRGRSSRPASATIAWAMPSTSWSRLSRPASSEMARSRPVIVRVESASRALPMAVAMWSAKARARSVSSAVQA